MVIKSGHISNPLTIIAIFAGLAEIGGTVILPLLSESNQSIFMWYVMGFPTLLVALFFYVLYHKREALYAPKDYENENNFISTLPEKSSKNNFSQDNSLKIEENNISINISDINNTNND
jgi:hypothetical protein